MINPLVSVCLITYKHENYIRQAIESVFIQKVNFPFELIIADDCSPDQTRAIIEKYKNQHPELIRLIFQKKNVGAGRNFLDLLNSANGKYIAYLEGDDYWTDPLKLQTQFDFMEKNPDFSLCYHKINWIFNYKPADLSKIPSESNINDKEEYNIYDILELGWFIRTCSMFFKNFELPNEFEKLYIGDYPLHILLADKGKVGFINKCMATYRINNQGISETMLITDDLIKKIKNHKQQIFLLNYLNSNTNFKYEKEFKKKIFNEIYCFSKFLIKKNLFLFLKNLMDILPKKISNYLLQIWLW
jgi:glycosyltransferase involved in cell wall biosynthesis